MKYPNTELMHSTNLSQSIVNKDTTYICGNINDKVQPNEEILRSKRPSSASQYKQYLEKYCNKRNIFHKINNLLNSTKQGTLTIKIM